MQYKPDVCTNETPAPCPPAPCPTASDPLAPALRWLTTMPPNPQPPSSPKHPQTTGSHEKAALGYVDRLRQWRTRPEPDLSLNFLARQFKLQVEKPHKQLGKIAELWMNLVPNELLGQTRLESLVRGVLKVGVADSSTLYRLDRLLRQGVEAQLIRQSGQASLRKVQLYLSPVPPEISTP